jgi:coenzyme F420 hydrogenase subunit delta
VKEKRKKEVDSFSFAAYFTQNAHCAHVQVWWTEDLRRMSGVGPRLRRSRRRSDIQTPVSSGNSQNTGSQAEIGNRAGTIQDLFTKPVLIFGCGNILIGDDGFGTAVIDHLLENFDLPSDVAAFDVGTGIRGILFDLMLMARRPKVIFIVDAAFESGKRPGEIFEIEISRIAPQKVNDFSLHMFPSVNLLNDLQSGAGVKIRVLAVQAERLPDKIRQGLSDSVKAAVPGACQWLLRQIEETSVVFCSHTPS